MRTDSLVLLSRPDKWYLGAGDGLVWAPPFPAWHDTPGFWDDAHLLQYPVGPLFTVSFVEASGESLPARADATHWTPAHLALDYLLAPGLHAREVRSAPGERCLASEWHLENRSGRSWELQVVQWTAVAGESVPDDGVELAGEGLRLRRQLRDRKDQAVEVWLQYGLGPRAVRRAAVRSEHSGPTPNFALTPFYDRWTVAGGMREEIRLGGIDRRGLVYLGLSRRLVVRRHASARFVATVQVEVAPAAGSAVPGPAAVAVRGSPSGRAVRQWKAFTAEVPRFRSSDEHFNRYWWYRWYGLRLNRVPAGLGQYRHPTVCEGIGYFHQPISYSTMCHIRELRWCGTPAWAQGVAHTFLDRLRPDGSMPGRVYLNHLVQPDFYHADWGGAVADLLDSHPDPAWLAAITPALAAYGEWLVRTRDAEGSGMIDVVDQYETGQEYMSRYEAVDPDADRYGWENRLRLKGIDVTLYAWRLFQLLAERGPDAGTRATWAGRAARTAAAIRERMWDPGLGMFSDLDPATGERTRVKAAVCFYPYLTDLAGPAHLEGFGAHLFDPAEFWTPFPVPSSSVDDPRYSPDAEWKGKRHVCPWNGRVWPMTNSHVIDALARVVRLHRPSWAPQLVHLLRQFVRMMSVGGDPARPNCFEHYHPVTGRGSVYRGIDDYQHSWVNDLLARHVAGLLPRGAEGMLVDPLPFGGRTELRGAVVAGHAVDVAVQDGRFEVRVEGRKAGTGRVGRALEVRW
ncbi:MAG: hypothetical protein IPI38_12145 [Gemmatimonadetes bacterium]|nr:hypothetical protein [Gemmatimonadota bacterium]